jgi:N-acetylglutamate synthase-like GNAT family acetyltransferase
MWSIPINISIRRATGVDQKRIQQMVREERLDPRGLRWQNFVVAEDDGQIAGIGQIRPFPDCPELGSVITLKTYRGQGIARRIVERLLADWKKPGPIYVRTRDYMTKYYAQFGFNEMPLQDAPMPLRGTVRAASFVTSLFRSGFKIAIMRLDREL